MSGYPGYNPGQFQQPKSFPQPPNPQYGAAPNGNGNQQPMMPGTGFAPPPPGQGMPMASQPPPPGVSGGMPMTPGYGFAPPGQSGGPPPPGGPGQGPGMRMMNAPPPPGAGPGPGFGQGPPAPPGPGMPGVPGMMMQQPPGTAGLNSAMQGMNMNSNQPHQPNNVFQPQPPGGNMGPPHPNMSMGQPQPPGPSHPNSNSQFYGGGAPAPYPGAAPKGHGMGPVGNAQPTFVDQTVDYSLQIPKSIFRPTTTVLPATAAMAQSCKVPTGGIIRPFADPEDGESINVIRPSAGGIIRCAKCRTYVNPYVAWVDNGRKWRCNICSHENETASAYYCHLDAQNERKDKMQRPELSSCVVEWIAPAEYQVRPPQPPAYFFVIDVSAAAAESGMLTSTANAIKKSLDELPGRDRTMIGFITFDTSVHFYTLAEGSSNAQMMVVGDLDELFVPAPRDLLVYLKDAREAVDNLLDNLPTMFSKNTASASCLGPALKAAYTVLKSVGGKMCVFQSIIPNLADGALKSRENPRLMGTPDEVKFLRPASAFYRDTGLEFNKCYISVDMFLFPSQYMDVASLSEMPKVTAGSMHTYVAFDPGRDGPKFESQLYRRLTQPIAFEAVFRIRCSKGMRINHFYGNFNIRGQDLLSLPNCTSDSIFSFDLMHGEQSLNKPFVTVQSALLYTTSDGERRIRVATQAFRLTTRQSEFMASVDSGAVAALLSKQAMNVGIKSNLDNARNKLQITCVEMIRASKEGDKRTVSGYSVPSAQPGNESEDKKIPKNLELLPLYTLGLMKNVAFRGGTDVNPDERIATHMGLSTMFVEETLSFLYPRFFAIHSMDSQAGLPVNDDDAGDENVKTAGRNMILLPNAINLSVESLSSEGIYLLDNGIDSFIWVGRASDPAINHALFGAESLSDVDMSQIYLNSSGNDVASRVDSIIQSLREETENGASSVASRIRIVREGDIGAESRFFWNFIEDRAQFNGGTYSYQEFVQFVNSPKQAQGAPPAPMGRGPPGQGPPGAYPGPPAPGRSGPPPPGPPGPNPSGYGAPPPPSSGPPAPNGYGAPPPPGPPSGNYGAPPPPGPPSSGGYGGPPPPGPHSGNFGGPPPPGPPSSGGYGGPPPPAQRGYGVPPPPSSGPASYGAPPPPGPPSGGPPAPPRSYGAPPPPGPPQNVGMPPPPRY